MLIEIGGNYFCYHFYCFCGGNREGQRRARSWAVGGPVGRFRGGTNWF